MTDLEKFQREHGPAYRKLTQNSAFQAAMQLLNIRKIDEIASLSDERIERHGHTILGELRGHFSHENDLMILHQKAEFKLPSEDEDEYISPEQQAELQALVKRFREDRKK
jgi:hypothetical protein